MIEILQFFQSNGVTDMNVADEAHVLMLCYLCKCVDDILDFGMIGRDTIANETERYGRFFDNIDCDRYGLTKFQ